MTYNEALNKAMKYCAYQERCQQEVRQKLLGFGMSYEEAESIIVDLIGENFLNEERFSRAFVRGKFYFKDWGRIKIKAQLKQKEISDYCIRKGMEEIKEKDYQATLLKLAEKKQNQLNGDNAYTQKQKIGVYLNSKGYESELIWNTVNDLIED